MHRINSTFAHRKFLSRFPPMKKGLKMYSRHGLIHKGGQRLKSSSFLPKEIRVCDRYRLSYGYSFSLFPSCLGAIQGGIDADRPVGLCILERRSFFLSPLSVIATCHETEKRSGKSMELKEYCRKDFNSCSYLNLLLLITIIEND